MNINDVSLLIEYGLKLLWRGAAGSKTEVSSIIYTYLNDLLHFYMGHCINHTQTTVRDRIYDGMA